MSSIQAAVWEATSSGATPIVKTIPAPVAAAGDILVRVSHVALNPVDNFLGVPGSVVGFDLAGEVVTAGGKLAKGSRVAGMVQGSFIPNYGAAAELVAADPDLFFKIPDGLDAADATTFSVSAVTAGVAVYKVLGLPFPPATAASGGNAPWFLVSGGATTVGLFAIQFAKLAGYRVIATASARSEALVKSYGADKIVNYTDPRAAELIREATGGGVQLGLEAAGGSSFPISIGSVSNGKLAAVLPTPDDVTVPPGVEVETLALIRAYKTVRTCVDSSADCRLLRRSSTSPSCTSGSPTLSLASQSSSSLASVPSLCRSATASRRSTKVCSSSR